MRMFSLLITFLASYFLVPTALARPDGNSSIGGCSAVVRKFDGEESNQYVQMGICIGYVQGIINSELAIQIQTDGKLASFCPPEEINNIQAVRIVEKYMKEHPEELHMHEYIIVTSAFKNAFPCKKAAK